MSTTTFQINPTTLPVGSTTFPPSVAHSTLLSLAIEIDRTITGGLNEAPAELVFTIEVDLSFDGGTTWIPWSLDTTHGGFQPDDHNQPETVQPVEIQFTPAIPRGTRLRAICTVTLQPVKIAGTISVTG